MEDSNRRIAESVASDRSYFRCIRSYRWKLDDAYGSGRCGDIYLRLKRFDEDWFKAIEVGTRQPRIVPTAFVERITTDHRSIRMNLQRRATVALTDMSVQDEADGESESLYVELTPPSSLVREFLVPKDSSRRRQTAPYVRSFTVDGSHTRDTTAMENLEESDSFTGDASSGRDYRTVEADLAANSGGNDYENLPKRSQERTRTPHAPIAARMSMPSIQQRLSRQSSADVSALASTGASSVPPIPRRLPSQRTQRPANIVSEVQTDRTRLRERLRGFFAKRTSAELLKQRGILKDEPIFGAYSIQQICEREQSSVASLVDCCLHYIELNSGWLQEGLYRVSGNLSVIQKLRVAINSLPLYTESLNQLKSASTASWSPKLSTSPKSNDNTHVDKLALQNASPNGFEQFSAVLEQLQCSVHEVTGLLKLFFRELQSALFDADEHVISKLIEQAATLSRSDSQESATAAERRRTHITYESLHMFKLTVRTAYPSQLGTMMRLFLHLEKVAQYEHINKMSVQNLALVFTPSLFPCSIAFSPSSTFVTTALIDNASFIFNDQN